MTLETEGRDPERLGAFARNELLSARQLAPYVIAFAGLWARRAGHLADCGLADRPRDSVWGLPDALRR